MQFDIFSFLHLGNPFCLAILLGTLVAIGILIELRHGELLTMGFLTICMLLMMSWNTYGFWGWLGCCAVASLTAIAIAGGNIVNRALARIRAKEFERVIERSCPDEIPAPD